MEKLGFIIIACMIGLSTNAQKETTSNEKYYDDLVSYIYSKTNRESVRFIDSMINTLGVDTINIKYPITLYFKGYLQGYIGEDFENARKTFLKALNIIDLCQDTNVFTKSIQAKLLSRIGSDYHVMEDIKGVDYLLQANLLYNELGLYSDMAKNYRTISTYFDNTSSNEPVLFFQNLGLRYMKKNSDYTQTQLAYAYRGMAHGYSETNVDSAMYYWQKASEIILNDTTANPHDILNLLAGTAEYAIYINRPGDAKEYTSKVYSLANQLYGEESVISAHICFQHVAIYGAENNYDSAYYYAEKGFDIYDQMGEKYIWKINAYNKLKEIEKKRKNFDKALELAHKAMFVNAPYIPEPDDKKSVIPLDSTYYSYEKLGNALNNKMELYHLLYQQNGNFDDLNNAYTLNLKIIDYLLNVHYKNSISTSETSNGFDEGIHMVVSNLLWNTHEIGNLKDINDVVNLSYGYLSSLKVALLKEQSKINHYQDIETAYQTSYIIDSLRSANEKLLFKRMYNLQTDVQKDSVDNLLVTNYIQLLKEKDKLKKNEQTDNSTHFLIDFNIKEHLSETEAVLDYFYNDSLLYIYVATVGSITLVELQNNALEINIKKHLRALKTGEDNKEYAQLLYDQLIEPVKPLIDNKQKLVIIPYKKLTSLPFETFSNTKSGYLVDTYEIAYKFSILNIEENENKNSEFNILAVAPSFQSTDVIQSSIRGGVFNDKMVLTTSIIRDKQNSISNLPYALMEVDLIKKINPEITTLLIGEEATEENFRNISDKYQVIHIASHGYSSIKNPELSGIFFCSQEQSLANDGYLYASEISTLNLAANLVVLSACQSGIGDSHGIQGAINLPRYFIAQDVPNVIASLWKVDDERTKDLMVAFYKHLLEDKVSYAEALRLAKLDCIKKGFLPLDWAGFILIGE